MNMHDDDEPITFSEEEWAEMLSDPKYGYICEARRHRIDRYHEMRGWDGSCVACDNENEAAYHYEMARTEAIAAGDTDYLDNEPF